MLDRRGALLEKSSQRRVLLEDSFRLQQFERDCDETKGWINEKLKFATDDSYLDPTNLNGKVQKHQTFEQELTANKSRIEELDAVGRELVEGNHWATDRIHARLEEIVRLWETLLAATERKGTRLAQASQQQQFNRGVEDLEIWLSEVEGQLLSEDYGKDLTSVQNLQKKHALLEADVTSHQDRIDAIRSAAQQFIESGHFDVDSILAKQVSERDFKHPTTTSMNQFVFMYLLGWRNRALRCSTESDGFAEAATFRFSSRPATLPRCGRRRSLDPRKRANRCIY